MDVISETALVLTCETPLIALFAIEGLETTYMKGPRPLSYTYLGRANIA